MPTLNPKVVALWNATEGQWSDWRWQLRNAVKDSVALSAALKDALGAGFKDTELVSGGTNQLEVKVTPHVIANIVESYEASKPDAVRSLLATYAPTNSEQSIEPGSSPIDDGRGELGHEYSPVRSIINFYHNRVLLMTNSACPSYCRYCFRRSVIGDSNPFYNRSLIAEGIQYVRDHPEISEVILSGGDPMVLADGPLTDIFDQLVSIAHVKMLRIDTKALTSLPQRFTPDLCDALSRYKPIYVMGNFLHEGELSQETIKACGRLIDRGIPVYAHTALLRGINDSFDQLQDLFNGLMLARVKPYYLIHFIPTRWTEHFRVPINEGLRLYEELHANLSGLALPTYIIYLPDGRGKVPILPQFLVRHEGNKYYFRSFEGYEVCYVDGPDT